MLLLIFREDFACSVCSNLNVTVAYRNTAGVGIDEYRSLCRLLLSYCIMTP